MIIDRNSPLPLYFQLKEILLENIQSGAWKPGEKIPTEETIQNEYGLSRTTVRQAMQALEQSGQVTRQAGRGTFVRIAKVQEGTEPYAQTITEINPSGVDLSFKIISTNWIPAPQDIATLLQIAPGTNVFCLRRLRLANQCPIGHTISFFVENFYENLDLSRAETGGSMNFIRNVNLDRYTVERIVEAVMPSQEDMHLLDMEKTVPALMITRVLRDEAFLPIEVYRVIYRSDRFRYHIHSLPPQL